MTSAWGCVRLSDGRRHDGGVDELPRGPDPLVLAVCDQVYSLWRPFGGKQAFEVTVNSGDRTTAALAPL